MLLPFPNTVGSPLSFLLVPLSLLKETKSLSLLPSPLSLRLSPTLQRMIMQSSAYRCFLSLLNCSFSRRLWACFFVFVISLDCLPATLAFLIKKEAVWFLRKQASRGLGVGIFFMLKITEFAHRFKESDERKQRRKGGSRHCYNKTRQIPVITEPN